jgi:hypothetical protein
MEPARTCRQEHNSPSGYLHRPARLLVRLAGARQRGQSRGLAASAVACVVGKGEEACCRGRAMAILPKQEFWPVSMTDQRKSLAAEGIPDGQPSTGVSWLVMHPRYA